MFKKFIGRESCFLKKIAFSTNLQNHFSRYLKKLIIFSIKQILYKSRRVKCTYSQWRNFIQYVGGAKILFKLFFGLFFCLKISYWSFSVF